ncbi:hypothetical protein [Chryseobacterium sp.]|uniref:hypothetical protein n=1 Tax=Chryseobacterium sp. TaxID=1871047 RepID=UPI003890B0FF
MKKTKFAAVLSFVYGLMGWDSLPKGEDGKLDIKPEEEATLKTKLTGKNYDAFQKVANEILAEEAGTISADEAEAAKVNDLLASVLKGNAGDDDDDDNAPATPEATAKKVVAKVQQQQGVIQALMDTPETESTMKNVIKSALFGTALVASISSPTHLFGANAEASTKLFEFEGRNWNMKAAGKSAAKTDFTDVSTITRLNQDLVEYQIQNPSFIRDLYVDNYGLPAFWPKRFGVIDMVQDVVMDIANVTQGRKPDWTPGFEMKLDAKKRRIYRIQIDLEFEGYQLQELESSWLASIYNMDGSSPYKYSFVAFLISKINEKARQEDREAAIKGIFAPNPAGIKMKGHYLNGQSGVLHQLFIARDVLKEITPYASKVGRFSTANAYSYTKGFIESMPLGARNKPNMKLYTAPSNIVVIKDDYKKINSLNNDYSGNELKYIDGYPNIEFVGLEDLEGTNVMFITDDQNIEILEYLPEEKNKYRFEYLKRKSFVQADYRTGCGIVFTGFPDLPANSNYRGVAQFVWINDEPLFPDTTLVPLFGKPMSGAVTLNYNKLYVHPELISDVTKLQGLPAGMVVKIIGDVNMQTTSKILKSTAGNAGNLSLTANFDPKTMYSLTMVVQSDGTYKEVARNETFPTNTAKIVEFKEAVIDASEGHTQKFSGDEATTLTEIVEGNEGTELKILGSANALSVAAISGHIVLSGVTAVLNSDAKYITLKNFEGVWYEIARG